MQGCNQMLFSLLTETGNNTSKIRISAYVLVPKFWYIGHPLRT